MENRLIIPRNDLSIVKARTVEIPLKADGVGAQNFFLLDEVLNPKATGSVIFTGMEVFTVLQQSQSNSQRPIVSLADALNLSIVMMYGNEEIIYQSPYTDFLTSLNFGMIRRLNNKKFSLTSCYLLNQGALANKLQSALVTFFYKPK